MKLSGFVGCFLSAVMVVGGVVQTGSAQTGGSGAGANAALTGLFKEMWEDELKHSPEFASALGDRRWNDQLSELSARAANDELTRGRGYLARLAGIDPAGLSAQEKLAAETVEQWLIEDEAGAKSKHWEMPVTAAGGIQTSLPALADTAPFEMVKDYDDWIARMKKVPVQIRQVTEDIMAGIDEGRVQPAAVLEAAEKQCEMLAGQAPEASVFAGPLKRFPAAVGAADRKRISEDLLAVIQDEVLPSYGRFARFLKVQGVPAGQKAAGAGASNTVSANRMREEKILELRAKAKAGLGAKFDAAGFRTLLASSYGLPEKALEERVNAWIAAGGKI